MTTETSLPKLLFLIIGTYTFYLFYGITQEAIWSKEDNGDQFKSTSLLLFIQCVVNALGAVIFLTITNLCGSEEKIVPQESEDASKPSSALAETAPGYIRALFGKKLTGNLWMGVIALFYVSAMGASNQALQHVNYPTQALGKSCKMIPIMAANVFINGKKYSNLKYFSAFCITVGIVMFRVFKASSKTVGANSNMGLMLLLASLCLDGLTASNQTNYRNEFSSPTVRGALRMMRQTNIWACLYVGVLALATGDFFTGMSYLTDHPHLWSAILKFSLCSACGQCFIFLTITGPGPLVCTTITTTRKFFTILISVFLNPKNTLEQAQWAAVGVVFTGLGTELYEKYTKASNKKAKSTSAVKVKDVENKVINQDEDKTSPLNQRKQVLKRRGSLLIQEDSPFTTNRYK